MRTLPLLFVPALVAGCVFPQFKATKVVEFSVPAKDLQRVDCETHNGDIKVDGDAAATEVSVHVEMSVRGHTQAEADANLHLLEVAREEAGGTLRLFGKYPQAELSNRSPSFRFQLKVPQKTSLELESHNGDLHIAEIEGNAKLETHNGDIGGYMRAGSFTAYTHNGDVELRMATVGGFDGTITTHNGDVDLLLADGLGARVDASTHNGRVTKPAHMTTTRASKRRVTGQVGDGSGKLVVTTHNGDVVLRDGSLK